MNVMNIYVDLGENVTNLNVSDNKDLSLFIGEMSDIKKNEMDKWFPDIIEKTKHDEVGMEYLLKITDEINVTNEKKSKKMEKIFSSKKPIVTYIFTVICIIMFVVSGFGIDMMMLVIYGANVGSLVKSGEVYRLISYMFLHGGIFHIFFNMYSLYIVGPKVEDFFGKWKYFFIYMASGITGGLLSIALNGDVISVGASGAIFG
jgi:rhomboid protease GluP